MNQCAEEAELCLFIISDMCHSGSSEIFSLISYKSVSHQLECERKNYFDMDMTPKVSVIIPTYNRAEFLHTAISSVLNQTYRDFEVIVVDDASNGNTREVVAAFNDKRIRYVRHDKNKGEAGARNTGILNTKGEYIAFLDDDDEWLPEKLMSQVRILENNSSEVGLVYSGYLIMNRSPQKILGQRIPSKRGFIYDDNLKCNLIGAPSTVVIRKECIRKVGFFDENISYGLDHDLWIRISKYYHFDYVDKPLVNYYIHKNRLSTNPEIRARGMKDMMAKYGKRMILRNNYYRSSYLAIGIEFCNEGNMNKGRKALLTAIRFNPLKINPYFYFGISLLSHKNYLRLKNFKETATGRIRANGSGIR